MLKADYNCFIPPSHLTAFDCQNRWKILLDFLLLLQKNLPCKYALIKTTINKDKKDSVNGLIGFDESSKNGSFVFT